MEKSASQIDWSLLPVSAFVDHAALWDEINDGHWRSPLLTSDFTRIALEHFGDGKERLAIARVGSRAVAAGVIDLSRRLSAQTFQAAQAPIGAWVQDPAVPIGELAVSLLAKLPLPTLVFGVTQLDPDLLPIGQAAGDPRIETRDYIRTARITVRGTSEEFWRGRGTNLRQNLRRQRNKLTRENISTRLEILETPAAMAAAVDDFGRMESAGWKGKEGTALHPDNSQGRFYRDLMTRLAEFGGATIYRYYFAEQLVATDLWVSRGGTHALLKTTHDESRSKVSPTMLMRQEMFDGIFDGHKFERIEFYGRVMEWHTRWTDEIRTQYHCNAYRRAWLRRIARRPSSEVARANASSSVPAADSRSDET